jgi:hypothetical protein
LQTVEETQKPVVEQPEVTETTVEEETVTIEKQVMCPDSYYRLKYLFFLLSKIRLQKKKKLIEVKLNFQLLKLHKVIQ